jgi:hypothetical protein
MAGVGVRPPGYIDDVDARRHDADRQRYEQGLEDYHDPTAGIGGAPPARSALTLRLLLAGFGFVVFAVATILFWSADAPGGALVCAMLAVVAAVNVGWVARRKRRGEPG